MPPYKSLGVYESDFIFKKFKIKEYKSNFLPKLGKGD